MAVDNATMVKDAIREINEQSERDARQKIKNTLRDIIQQQNIIEVATKKISDLKITLKEINYKETDVETVS